MGGPVESVTLEVIDEGVVEEVRRLGQGCFTLGDDPKVELIVGSGGCWVVGPLNRVFINGVTRERTELAGGELVTFGAVTLRVWPRATPLTSRPRLSLSTKRPKQQGLSIELWWQGQQVHHWQIWATEVRLPSELLALDGYSLGKRVAMRAGDSYRFFVPAGCEASEPLESREVLVPRLRQVVITRGRLSLKVALTNAKRAHPALSAAVGLAAMIAAVAVTLGCDVADAQWPVDHRVVMYVPRCTVMTQRPVQYVALKPHWELPGAKPHWLRSRTVWSSRAYVLRIDHDDSGARYTELILQQGAKLLACENARTSGRHYRLQWVLGPDGVLRFAHVSAPVPDELSECVLRVLKGIPFSIGAAPVTISFENR